MTYIDEVHSAGMYGRAIWAIIGADSLISSKKPSSGRLAMRVGRPPRKLAGEVDQRILDAARRVLFERGLTGASIDEIAAIARQQVDYLCPLS